MPFDEEKTREMLKPSRIVVIEDDSTIQKRLVRLFRQYSDHEVSAASSMKEALDIIDSNLEQPFDLAIIDAMLPNSEAELEQIRNLENEAKELRKQIAFLMQQGKASVTEQGKGSGELRTARTLKLEQISSILNKEAGIEIVEQLQKYDADQCRCILFLTAVGNPEVINKGVGLCEEGGRMAAWLVKPAPRETILTACAGLLQASKIDKGGTDG